MQARNYNIPTKNHIAYKTKIENQTQKLPQ